MACAYDLDASVAVPTVGAFANAQLPFAVTDDVAPPTAEPMLMLVVDPETPAVPKLTVLVVPFVVAPVAKLSV